MANDTQGAKVDVLKMVENEPVIYEALRKLAVLASKQKGRTFADLGLFEEDGGGECLDSFDIEGVDFGKYVVDEPSAPKAFDEQRADTHDAARVPTTQAKTGTLA